MPNSAIQVPGQTWLFYKLTVDNWQQMVHGAETGTPIARWSNGIALRRYRRGALQPGGGLPITLTWTVEGPVSDELYHFGSYLLTSENGVVAQTDGPGFGSDQWSRTEAFITWHEIPLPPELAEDQYRVGLVLYTWPELMRSTLASGENIAFLETVAWPSP
jgi:hypothetical protein